MAEPVQTSEGPDRNIGNGPGVPNAEVRVGGPHPDANGRGWDGSPKREDRVLGARAKTVTDYVSRLGEEHKMLLALKGHLYGGSWDPMLDDLRNRMAGKPYIFKLVHRIQDDIERIEEMRNFETEHKIDLTEYMSD